MTVNDYLQFIILPIFVLSTILIFVRFIQGPSLSDRVVALDLLITTGIGAIAVFSVVADEEAYLDVGIILALISFLSSVAFAYYIEKKKRK